MKRIKVRRMARECYIEAGGDLQLAEQIAREKLQRYGFIDLATIAAILQICFLLWQFWQSFRLEIPPEYPAEGEPHVELDNE